MSFVASAAGVQDFIRLFCFAAVKVRCPIPVSHAESLPADVIEVIGSDTPVLGSSDRWLQVS